jgi:lysozyme
MNLERIKETLKKHEGEKLEMYQCSMGCHTIGVGHNLDSKPISKRVSDLMLEDDVEDSIADCKRNISFFDDLDDGCQEALVNLCFNMGIAKLLQFKKTLAYLKDGKREKAANELLNSRYATQVGYRAIEVAAMIKGGK